MVTKKNIDPEWPASRPTAPVLTNAAWGKTLTKQQLINLLNKLDSKKKEREMSKLSDTLQRALDKKKGIHHPDNGDALATDAKVKKVKTAAPINNKPPTRSAGRGR
jgi:hypothetical protein